MVAPFISPHFEGFQHTKNMYIYIHMSVIWIIYFHILKYCIYKHIFTYHIKQHIYIYISYIYVYECIYAHMHICICMHAYVYLASSLTLFQPTSGFDDFPSLPWDAENTGDFGCTGTRETAAANDLIF